MHIRLPTPHSHPAVSIKVQNIGNTVMYLDSWDKSKTLRVRCKGGRFNHHHQPAYIIVPPL